MYLKIMKIFSPRIKKNLTVSFLPALGYRACVRMWQLFLCHTPFRGLPQTLVLKYMIQLGKGPNLRPRKRSSHRKEELGVDPKPPWSPAVLRLMTLTIFGDLGPSCHICGLIGTSNGVSPSFYLIPISVNGTIMNLPGCSSQKPEMWESLSPASPLSDTPIALLNPQPPAPRGLHCGRLTPCGVSVICHVRTASHTVSWLLSEVPHGRARDDVRGATGCNLED